MNRGVSAFHVASSASLIFAAAALVAIRGSWSGTDSDVARRYQDHCQSCHGVGAADAPVAHVPGDWEHRVSKGLDALVAHTRQGPFGMPPRGGCATCTDEDLEALIVYMSEPR